MVLLRLSATPTHLVQKKMFDSKQWVNADVSFEQAAEEEVGVGAVGVNGAGAVDGGDVVGVEADGAGVVDVTGVVVPEPTGADVEMTLVGAVGADGATVQFPSEVQL